MQYFTDLEMAFTGWYLLTFSFFSADVSNINCGCSLEPPRWGGSNEYPQSMFLSQNKKNNLYPYQTHFSLYKEGVSWGIHCTDLLT